MEVSKRIGSPGFIKSGKKKSSQPGERSLICVSLRLSRLAVGWPRHDPRLRLCGAGDRITAEKEHSNGHLNAKTNQIQCQ